MSDAVTAVLRRAGAWIGVLALLVSLPEGLHAAGLHGEHLGSAETVVSSSCKVAHPPRFEAAVEAHRDPCQGCLLQLQQRGLGTATASVALATGVLAGVDTAPAPPPLARGVSPTAPRGPPTLHG